MATPATDYPSAPAHKDYVPADFLATTYLMCAQKMVDPLGVCLQTIVGKTVRFNFFVFSCRK